MQKKTLLLLQLYTNGIEAFLYMLKCKNIINNKQTNKQTRYTYYILNNHQKNHASQ